MLDEKSHRRETDYEQQESDSSTRKGKCQRVTHVTQMFSSSFTSPWPRSQKMDVSHLKHIQFSISLKFYEEGRHSGTVVRTVTSEQEGAMVCFLAWDLWGVCLSPGTPLPREVKWSL